MEYTVQKLAKIAGVSTRTLRYYDEIGLLKPAKINSSGYRIYGRSQIDALQQIMFYRELGIALDEILKIMQAPSYDSVTALRSHHEKLIERKEQIEKLIANVEKTIATKEGRLTMSDNEKFEGFKKKALDENEKKYGKEIRKKYGEETVNKSNKKFKNMSQEEHARATALAEEIALTLEEAFNIGDPSSQLAQKACELHKQWLCIYWDTYSKEAHANLTQMYVDDDRFRKYYDIKQPGTVEFLRDAMLIYTKE